MTATTAWTIPNLLTVTRILLTPGFVMAFVELPELQGGLMRCPDLTDLTRANLAPADDQRDIERFVAHGGQPPPEAGPLRRTGDVTQNGLVARRGDLDDGVIHGNGSLTG